MSSDGLGDAATAEGMQSDSPEAFWQLDHALGPSPSGRALQTGLEKALVEGKRCVRPLRLQCDGHGTHRAHWRYAPCDTRYSDQCQPCAGRYAAQMRAVIQGGLKAHANEQAIAFTLTAPGADEFGDAPRARKPTSRPFDYLRAVAWNASLRQAVHDFIQRVKREVTARGGTADRVAYWVVIEFQQRGLGHLHGIFCGVTETDIVRAAHGPPTADGGVVTQVKTRVKDKAGPELRHWRVRRRGHATRREVAHLRPASFRAVRDEADALTIKFASAGRPFSGKHWARVPLPTSDDEVMAADEFIDMLDHRTRSALGREQETTTTLDWRWGEQVYLERFDLTSARARGRLARYLAKYVTKSIGVTASGSTADARHRQALLDAAALLPCATHGFYLCGCTLEASAVASFGLVGNPYSQSRNWGTSLTEIREARTMGEVRECSWTVVGAGYPTLVGRAMRDTTPHARTRPSLDLRGVLRSLRPSVAGPAAP